MKIDFMWLKSIFNLISIHYLCNSTLKPTFCRFLCSFSLCSLSFWCIHTDLDTPRAINAMKIDYFSSFRSWNVLTMSFISLSPCTITILSAFCPLLKLAVKKSLFLSSFFVIHVVFCLLTQLIWCARFSCVRR
jgi:hypothetical protein